MAYRLTDRDCLAALIRVAHYLNKMPNAHRCCVALPASKYRKDLEDLAEALEVTTVLNSYTAYNEDGVDVLALERVSGCYGGGVRPYIVQAGETGHHTPRWWSPSAGLGPAGRPRRTFLDITEAVCATARDWEAAR